MKTAVSLLLFIALCLTASTAFAQESSVRVYTTRDGLAGNYITALAQAPDGSMWVGTTEGATHISDVGWVSYTAAHGLGSDWVTAIDAGSADRVWFGTQGGGLSELDLTARTLTTYNLDNSNIPSNFVTAVATDKRGHVWVGTLNNGIGVFDPVKNEWTTVDIPNPAITFLGVDSDSRVYIGTEDGAFLSENGTLTKYELPMGGAVKRIEFEGDGCPIVVTANGTACPGAKQTTDYINPNYTNAEKTLNLTPNQITALHGSWVGTPRGLAVPDVTAQPQVVRPLPVVLVHGWTVAGEDTLATSEFQFLKSYADRDGIPMYYVQGVKPENTLYQNAAVIRETIARVKKETGADKVNLVGFSMGGMNSRAYLETSLYGNDVDRVVILGTPQAGVEVWKPILMQQILEKHTQPSAIELSPEYAQQIVNDTRAPNPGVTYDLLIGDARQQAGLNFLEDMPASDALISVDSALALDAPNVNKHVNTDLHDWGPQAVPLDLTSYLYPRTTWERYLRNALRNGGEAPMGSEVLSATLNAPLPVPASPSPPASLDELGTGTLPEGEGGGSGNHTPVVSGEIGAGETVTRTVVVDENASARFVAYYPGGNIDFSLVAPDGKRYDPSDLPRDEDGVLSLSTDIASFSGYVVKDAPAGEWQLVLKRTDSGSAPVEAATYVILDTPRTLQALTRQTNVTLGASNTITAFVRTDAGEIVPNVKMRARVAEPSATPGGAFTTTEFDLFDDGQHNDGAAQDGIFANDFMPTRAGWHIVWVDAAGEGFTRANEMLFAVNPGDVQIQLPIAGTPSVAENDGTIQFNVGVTSPRAGEFAVSAALKQADTGTVVARTFIPLHLEAGTSAVPIAFDTSRLAQAPYVLDVVLLDANWAALELDRATLRAQ